MGAEGMTVVGFPADAYGYRWQRLLRPRDDPII
jgi:hypothetical protein